ncbi:response regulator [Cohnella herbarum]|uniref:Response regulator n=1 Tax=Cohnella herbarum TaxID=2728023 RepID=A0A7Z2VI48_9BACL|nr:response regulator [Cohnella herbarum]QJD83507.1 response regulator [Cohnella herbarum]
MKALIIDDEKHVREAIRLLVPWDNFGITDILEAADGQAAIRLIESEKPAIIFTDMMMPHLGGVEILAWAVEHAPCSKIIVISGHDDFEFVRQTVKYGGMDYLLKPIDETQLLAALSKAIVEWTSDEEARSRNRTQNMEINQLKPVYLDKFFSTLLNEPLDHSIIQETLQQQFGTTRPIVEARLCMLSLELTPPFIRDKFAAGWDLLIFSLINICNEFLRDRKSGFAFRHWGQENEIIILLWKDTDRAENLLTEINEGIYKVLKTRFCFGVGNVVAFPGQLQTSYKQARAAIRLRNLRSTGKWIQCFSALETVPKNSIFFTEHEQKIRYAVLSGDKELLSPAFEAWFKAVEQCEIINLEQIQLWWQEFRLAQSMWKKGCSDPAAVPGETQLTAVLDNNGDFTLAEWKASYLREALSISELLSDEAGSSSSSMQAIAKYIDQFLHEELSLQDISNRFFLSREYISRKFKQEMNENLTDYITRARIDRAKKLLADTPLKIAQISEMVGFQDEKYFSKVFKKGTDCSPNEYRKHRLGDD